MEISTIIFDCFGVLYPSYIDEFLKQHNEISAADYRLINTINTQIDLGEISQSEFYEQLGKILNIPADYIRGEVEETLIVDTQLTKLIKELSKKYKIGLLSNAGKEEIEVIYRDKIESLFDVITVSYEIGDVKPNPKIFNTCLERLGSKPAESVFIDDSIKNLKGAQSIELQTIHYNQFGVIPEDLRKLATWTQPY
jgi:HAD superfamily hydrolase (TIGR01509 family)